METVNAKLWRNYQILVPSEVIETLSIKPGEFLRFVITDDADIVVERGTKK